MLQHFRVLSVQADPVLIGDSEPVHRRHFLRSGHGLLPARQQHHLPMLEADAVHIPADTGVRGCVVLFLALAVHQSPDCESFRLRGHLPVLQHQQLQLLHQHLHLHCDRRAVQPDLPEVRGKPVLPELLFRRPVRVPDGVWRTGVCLCRHLCKLQDHTDRRDEVVHNIAVRW